MEVIRDGRPTIIVRCSFCESDLKINRGDLHTIHTARDFRCPICNNINTVKPEDLGRIRL